MAQLVRFEQDPEAPEGAGTFHFDAGEPMYAYEPELAAQATQVKSALDSAPDNRTAKVTSQDLARSLREQGQAQDQADLRSVADAGSEFGQPANIPSAPPPGQPPRLLAPPPPEQGPPPGDMATMARDVMGQRAAEEILRGTKRTYVGGSPGVNPHQMREQGVMVPTQQNVVQESGAPYDPNQAALRIAAAEDVRSANLADLALQKQQTENQLASQRAIAPKLQKQAAVAEANHNRMLSAYRADRSRLQQELDDYEKKAHVNPDRFFEDRGLFATIGMAIAQGMGAYASTMTGAPNFAYEMVQKAIERDISAQRDQIEAGRVSRRNKLAMMMDNYGYDLDQAEAAMRIAMNKSADLQASMFAAESKLPQYQVEAQKFNALTNQEIIKNEQALQNASFGKYTRSQQEAFVQPKAATGGGYIEKPLTPEELAARAKLLPKDQGADVEELEPKERLRITNEYGEQRQNFASLQSTYDDLAKAMGYRIDWKTKQLVDNDGKPVDPNESGLFGKNPDIPGIGIKGPDFARSQAGRRVIEAQAKARAITGKYLSGASVSPQQDEMIQSYLIGNTDAAALRGMQRALADLDKVDRDVQARYPEQIRAEYERRARNVNREIKTAPAPVKVTPY